MLPVLQRLGVADGFQLLFLRVCEWEGNQSCHCTVQGPVKNMNRPQEAARYSAMLVYHVLTVIHAIIVIARVSIN